MHDSRGVELTDPVILPGITRQQWRTLAAAHVGYMLDAADVFLYVFALNRIRVEFGLTNAEAGLVATITLMAAAAGGIIGGILTDRLGRTRMLVYTILIYSAGSAGTALSSGLVTLVIWRAVVGIGLGGEWAAGAVLVSETWPAQHRAKAIGWMQSGWAIGYLLAAAASAIILPRYGWRWLFAVGFLPATIAVVIRRKVKEPELWNERDAQPDIRTSLAILRAPLLWTTVRATALTTSVLFAYWGLFTWLPGFLSAPVSAGGAGLSMLQGSTWMIPTQIGAFLGYISFGWLADRLGRRPAFALYVICAACLTPIYGHARSETVLLALGPLIGFFGTGFFSLFGVMLAELYPTVVRGAGQGFTYSTGRGLGALAPYAVGSLADRFGLGASLILNSAFFLLGAVLIWTLPETEGVELE
ncbi:MAG TPA: MFS transporter [Bryobacteraceae bacterium]